MYPQEVCPHTEGAPDRRRVTGGSYKIMQIPTSCRVGLLHSPADSTKTRPRNSPYFRSCANILDDIFTDAVESADGLYTTEMWRMG